MVILFSVHSARAYIWVHFSPIRNYGELFSGRKVQQEMETWIKFRLLFNLLELAWSLRSEQNIGIWLTYVCVYSAGRPDKRKRLQSNCYYSVDKWRNFVFPGENLNLVFGLICFNICTCVCVCEFVCVVQRKERRGTHKCMERWTEAILASCRFEGSIDF